MSKEDPKGSNTNFNTELQLLLEGQLPSGHVFNLGKPGEILQECGFPKNCRIELTAHRLKMKSQQENHPFNPADLMNLDKAINTPVAVFEYGDRNKAQNIIVNLQQDEKNYLVGVYFNQKQRGYDVSDIRGLFPRYNMDWLRWIDQGKMVYGDKEKIQVLATQQRSNFAEVSNQDARTSSDTYYLDSVDSILSKFGSVNHIFTRNFPFYNEQRERHKVFKKFREVYLDLESINIHDAKLQADQFYDALKNNNLETIRKFTNPENYEIAQAAEQIHQQWMKATAERQHTPPREQPMPQDLKEIQTQGAFMDNSPRQSPPKPYYQQNVELLLEALRSGKAPFLPQQGNHIKNKDVVVITPQPTVRLAMTGKVLKGTNQLIAQIQLGRMGKTSPVLTFEQVQKLGSNIRKGSESFTVTSYNPEEKQGKRLTVYHLFSAQDALKNQALQTKLNAVDRLTATSEKTIQCTSSSPEKFLGAYLAAGVTGRTLTVKESTLKEFRSEFQRQLEECIQHKNHVAAFDIGRKASNVCRSIMSQELKKERTQLYQYTNKFEVTR